MKFRRTKKIIRRLLGAFFLCTIVSCAGRPPLIEQAKSFVARDYAKKNKALQYSPLNFRKGDAYFKRAEFFFQERIYKKAKNFYIISRKYFEKAETRSRLIQIKKGGEF